jgi:hypothetical protein
MKYIQWIKCDSISQVRLGVPTNHFYFFALCLRFFVHGPNFHSQIDEDMFLGFIFLNFQFILLPLWDFLLVQTFIATLIFQIFQIFSFYCPFQIFETTI